MADDKVVVKKDKDGDITVCIGDRCVTVSCAEGETEQEKEQETEQESEVGRPPIRIEAVRAVDALGDVEALEWKQAGPGIETARDIDGSRLTRRQID